MKALMMLVVFAMAMGPQTPPTNLPPARKVTDPARPDFGYMQPWAGSTVTVAVLYSASCDDCDASVPFYRRLASETGIDGKTGKLTVVADGGIAPVAITIQKHVDGFRPHHVVSYPTDDRFEVTRFPTLAVFDGQWRKRGEWRGRLSASDEAAVLEVIRAIVRESRGKA